MDDNYSRIKHRVKCQKDEEETLDICSTLDNKHNDDEPPQYAKNKLYQILIMLLAFMKNNLERLNKYITQS